MNQHRAASTLDHLLSLDHMLTKSCIAESRFIKSRLRRLHQHINVILSLNLHSTTFLVHRLEPLANRAEKPFIAHFIALSAQFEVFGPFMTALGPCLRCLTILTLHAVFTPVALSLNVEFDDFIIIIFI